MNEETNKKKPTIPNTLNSRRAKAADRCLSALQKPPYSYRAVKCLL